MRTVVVLLIILQLSFCSYSDSNHPCIDEEEREREEREDKATQECRSCQPITISAEDNCKIGYECDPELQMTANILTDHDCACSEMRCADKDVSPF
ncbi:hypothetical protein PMAYCL1PPCAC_25380 [Pristionchus mayeri]|uniref:Uncharacterized protein n=1 Tax=Pristionchus mayeri TaxID=1317129 RepID=A0AAN5I8P3_9BILA|nr:hypothetical protein PMAYCL1PPCAC_25380 [Pristionchus mayeri]